MSKILSIINHENQRDIKYLKEAYESIWCIRIEALKLIEHFCEIIGLDKDIVKPMREVSINIDFNENLLGYANYTFKTNMIHIKGVNVIKDLKRYHNNIINYSQYERKMKYIIIHELLHSIRTLIIKNENNGFCYNEYDKLYSKYSNIISDENVQLLSVCKSIDSFEFCFYCDNQFVISKIKNEKLEDKSIYEFLEDYKNPRKLLSNLILKGANMNYIKPLNDDMVLNILNLNNDKNVGIEEMLIDCFAQLILYHETFNKYNPRVLEILKNHSSKDYYSIGFGILSKMNIEDFKWFMTSYMQDSYEDRLKDLYNNHYDEIINLSSRLYILFEKKKDIIKSEKYDKCLKLINEGE